MSSVLRLRPLRQTLTSSRKEKGGGGGGRGLDALCGTVMHRRRLVRGMARIYMFWLLSFGDWIPSPCPSEEEEKKMKREPWRRCAL